MNIEKNKAYKIKGESEYLNKKYGTSNPIIVIEGTDKEVFGCYWGGLNSNPVAMLYGMRAGCEGLLLGGHVYYGHIGGLGELVHESELEPTKVEEKEEE